MQLAQLTSGLCRGLPPEERFGLAAQMRRAAVSIASNVAEGQARRGTGEFVQFISHAEGSLAELETQLRLCLAFKFVDESQTVDAFSPMEELRKMLNALRRKLVARHSSLVSRHSSLIH